MNQRLANKVMIVTGAGRGIGRGIALLAARHGAKVVVNDPGGATNGQGSDNSPASQVVQEIVGAGGAAVADFTPVGTDEAAGQIVRTAVDAFGRVDVLVNNAGITRDAGISKKSADDFEAVVRTHLLGSGHLIRHVFPGMKERGFGRILCIVSSSGFYGVFGQLDYGAAKAGMLGLTNVVTVEGAKYNVVGHAICGRAVTRMSAALAPGIDPDNPPPAMHPDSNAPLVIYLASLEEPKPGGQFWRRTAQGIELISKPDTVKEILLAAPDHPGECWRHVPEGGWELVTIPSGVSFDSPADGPSGVVIRPLTIEGADGPVTIDEIDAGFSLFGPHWQKVGLQTRPAPAKS